MKIFKTTLLALALLAGSLTYAQDELVTEEVSEEATEKKPSFSVSGSIDTYYRSNDYAPNTSFANLPGFALGMANVVLSYEGEKSGFVADLVYGPRGADAVFGSEGTSSSIINQLYAYYNVNEKLTLTLGNFNTFLGYEVISPVANFNYSTSYMFSYGPFSHTGIKADYAFSDDISLMVGVFNQTDFTEGNFEYDGAGGITPYDDYMYGVQLGLYGQYINLLTGKLPGDETYTQIDFTGGFDLSDSFFLGINATNTSFENDRSFSGIALYPQLALSDSFSIGLRGELFKETESGAGAISLSTEDTDNTSFTITGSYTSGNLIIKPEFRIDSANADIYSKSITEMSDSLASFVVAAIYAF